MTRARAWGATALVIVACRPIIDYDDTHYRCEGSDDCPSGSFCVAGACRDELPPDATPPADARPQPDAPASADAAAVEALPDGLPCAGGDVAVTSATGHCYTFDGVAASWTAALATCAGSGAHLVTIDGPAENAFVAERLGLLDWWDGATDAPSEGLWGWHTGEAMSYQNWRTGEPNDHGTLGEDCGVLEGDNGGLWDDRHCDTLYPFVCERDF